MPLALAIFGYWAVLVYQLGAQWSAYEQYSYGWAVPILCAYLFWMRLQEPGHASRKDQSVKAVGTFAFVLLALVWAATRFVHEANPIWRLTSLLLALVVIGITLCLLRISALGLPLSAYGFPICFILLAVPWPSGIENLVTQKLMPFNAGATVELLNLAGVPAIRQGNVIETARGMVGVDEACSGIRSLQAVLMIALFFGELYRLRIDRRLTLLFGGLALDLLFNLGRTLLLTGVAASQGLDAMGRWHDSAGVAILVGCFCGVWFIGAWLRKSQDKRTKAESSKDKKPQAVSDAWSAWAQELPAQRRGQLRTISIALIAWLVLVEGGIELWYRSHELPDTQSTVWEIHWPESNPTLKRSSIAEVTARLLKQDTGSSATWREADGSAWQAYYLRWNPGRTVFRRVKTQLAKTHNPEHCLTAAGLRMAATLDPIVVRLSDNLNLRFRRFEFEKDGHLLHVFFAVAEDLKRTETDVYFRSNFEERILAALHGSRNFGYTTLEIAVSGYADANAAEAAFRRELPGLIVESPATNETANR